MTTFYTLQQGNRNVTFFNLKISHQSCKISNPLHLPHTCKQLLFQLQMHPQLNLEKTKWLENSYIEITHTFFFHHKLDYLH